jgi:membrane dipeptidase
MRLEWTHLAGNTSPVPDGTTVEIEGYLCPLGIGSTGYFALIPEPLCCQGCLPADPLRRVEVFLRGIAPPPGAMRRVTGTWRTLGADRAGWRYQLRDARLSGASFRAGVNRRTMLAGSLMCLAAAAPAEAPVDQATALAAIADRTTVDVHSHAGSITGTLRVRKAEPFTPLAEPMRQGGMAVVCLAIVSDSPTHRVMVDGRIHPFRTPDPGELYEYAQRSFARVQAIVKDQGLHVVTDAAGLSAARSSAPSIVIAAEGADFLEGNPGRVDEAYHRWQLRHLQLTHYRVNELGDIQTETPVHGGLTDAGADVIRRCNTLGLVVDVAHGTFDLVKRAASVTTKPLLLSHTSLSTRNRKFTRTITPDHARVIAGTGGVVGIWPPASIFYDLPHLAAGFARMVDVVGVDHVALGTDMQGLVGPSTFPSYTYLSGLAAALLDIGFNAFDVGKLLGGNYVRIFVQSMS